MGRLEAFSGGQKQHFTVISNENDKKIICVCVYDAAAAAPIQILRHFHVELSTNDVIRNIKLRGTRDKSGVV